MNNFKNLSKKVKAEYIAMIALYPLFLLFAQLGKVCKLFATKKKQIVASILCAAMILTMLPVMSLTAFAAEPAPTPTPLTFTAQEDDSSVTLNFQTGTDVKYKKNDGAWTDCPSGTSIALENISDTVSFKGTDVVTNSSNHFTMTGSLAASGDVTSLTNGVGGDATLMAYCYNYMFYDCISLTTAPQLPTTTLPTACYSNMFRGCTSLTAAPELPATTLAKYCYYSMFYDCNSLKSTPQLPATTLAGSCYQYMFYGCTSLKISTTNEGNYTKAWSIPSAGTITTTATEWNTKMLSGTGGAFTGNPAINATYYIYEEPTTPEVSTPLTFTAETAGSTVTLNTSTGTNVQYQKGNDGWTDYKMETVITLENVSDTVSFRGTNVTTCSGSGFSMTGKIAVSGDVTSLTNGVGGDATLTVDCYCFMFLNCTSLTTAPELPATKLDKSCYQSMFQGCTNLTTAPELPATTLVYCCYQSMFNGCTNLTAAPALPATKLAFQCYQSMFENCTSLTAAPALPATKLTTSCYQYMFRDCAGLKVSAVPTGNYTKEWRIPSTGTNTAVATAWNANMLSGTGGTFTGNPTEDTTYYIYVDTTEPVISGIENGKTYCQTAEITVTDDSQVTVTANGTALTASEGKYTLTAAGTNTVVATDKSGNSTTVTVTLNASHIYDSVCDSTCNACGETRTAPHSFGTEWSSDGTNHWHECSVCGEKKDLAAHTPDADDGNCTTPICCSVCHAVTTAAEASHDFDGAYEYDGTYHWHICNHDGCNATEAKVAHNGGTADFFHKAVCTACGQEYGTTTPDVTAPTNLKIQYNNNGFKSFLNTITFGIFFKETVTVTASAEDSESGIASYQYLASDSVITDFTSVAWQNSLSLTPNSKKIVYVKATDKAGNSSVVNYEGIVVYSDSTIKTKEIIYTKTSATDKTTQLDFNGNTIKEIKNGNDVIAASNYSVSNGMLIIKASYLESLAVNNYTLTISYNPMGATYVDAVGNEAPATNTIALTVQKAGGYVSNISNIGKNYNGEAVSAPTYTKTGTGEATIEYKAKNADDSKYTTTAPKNAGDYTVRVSVDSDANYNACSATNVFTISKKSVTISDVRVNATKEYDGKTNAKIISNGTISENYDGSNLSIKAGTAAYDNKNVGNGKAVAFSGFELTGSAKDNYELSAQPANVIADITAKPLTVNVSVNDKNYDGNNTASYKAIPSLNGVASSDTVLLTNGTPAFTSIAVANNISISFTDFSIYGADAANYTLTQPTGITASITKYTAVKNTEYTVNSNDWQKTDFAVSAQSGYKLSKTNTADGTWLDMLTATDETATGSMEFYVKNTTTGAISEKVIERYKIDKTAPTNVKIQYNNNGFKSFLNTITFGVFFKETVNVTASAEDYESGIASYLYLASDTPITDFTSAVWQNSLSLIPNSKKIVYVKATDNVGNTSVVNYEGIVVYSDSTISPATAAFDKNVDNQADVTFTMTLNDNTLKDVKNGATVLTSGTDYTENGNTVTVKKAYFAAQEVGMVTLTFSFYPMGVENNDNLSTATATITVSDTTHHHIMEHTSAVAATCTADGNTEYWYCSGCQKYFSNANGNTDITLESTVISKLGHSFTNYVSNDDAACTEYGTKTATCDHAGCTETDTITDTGSKLGHSFTNYVYNNDATYLADGTETATCENCDVTDTRTKSGTKLIDTTAPTGEIKISNSSFKRFINSITFGLFFKDSQDVTIIGSDAGIGVDKICYFKSETALEKAAVEALSAGKWAEGTSLTLSPDWQGVVYAKITDKSGNTLYISSDGLVFDATAPVLSGVTDGGKYCITATVVVTEENLDSVTLDSASITLTKGKFTVSAKDGTQTIVVTDKAGNEATATITIYAEHTWNDGEVTKEPSATEKGEKTYTCTVCGETKTEEIPMLAPSIIEGGNGTYQQGGKDGMTFKSNAALADFESVSVDGKTIDKVNYTTKEGSTIVTLTADYLATLSVGKHTLAINSTSGVASTEFTIAAKADSEKPGDSTKPGSSDSPQTGDTNNMVIWFALLFVSGGTLSACGIARKRKKANEK